MIPTLASPSLDYLRLPCSAVHTALNVLASNDPSKKLRTFPRTAEGRRPHLRKELGLLEQPCAPLQNGLELHYIFTTL